MSSIYMSGPVGFMTNSMSSVFFSGSSVSKNVGTSLTIKKLQNKLNVAYWGEDNRFPNNIEQQLAYCGLAKSALDWKARVLGGNGIIPGKVTGYVDEGKKEIFAPLDRIKYKAIYDVVNSSWFNRYFMEFRQDWVWFGNCFPELIFSNDGTEIKKIVHQESCDSRYEQMNEKGEIEHVLLSKLWGVGSDQYVKFDPNKRVQGYINGDNYLPEEFIKKIKCIDPYDSLDSCKTIAKELNDTVKIGNLKSAILPVNYPSVNKTYYQLPAWDGARLAGWFEIVSKIPEMLKSLYNKAFKIKYHIEIPESYFPNKYGVEAWVKKTPEEKTEAKKQVLLEMDKYLSQTENSLASFVSFFDINKHNGVETGRVKIEAIEDNVSIDKELLATSAGNVEILSAMGVHPTLFSAGMPGATHRSGGGSGSDLREAYLVYTSLLHSERRLILEPLYLMRDFNREVGKNVIWESDIEFRIRDTVLTTLDANKGTEKTVS